MAAANRKNRHLRDYAGRHPFVRPDQAEHSVVQARIAEIGLQSAETTFEDLGPRISEEIRKLFKDRVDPRVAP